LDDGFSIDADYDLSAIVFTFAERAPHLMRIRLS
jgi:hypothetical protein